METLLNEYLLIISPEENIGNEIFKIKYEFRDKYGCTHAAQLRPHCTLMNFVQHQHMENYLVRQFDSLATSFPPLKIRLDGFGQYPVHTIYIKVEDNKQIKKLLKALRLKFKSVLKGIKLFKPIYLSDPHLTIARRMTDTQFDSAWAEWGKRKFDSSFNTDSIRLLKRQISEKDLKPIENYQVVKDFGLTGQEEKEEQLTLF